MFFNATFQPKLRKLFVVTALLLSATAHVHAAPGSGPGPGFDDDFDDEVKTWQELAVQLPAQPEPASMVSFYVSPTSIMKFAIDIKSITVGTDGVVRYTLISTSSGGAENVSYEGIRCQTAERKLYAFGHKDGTWSRARLSKWQQITDVNANRQHAALFKDFLCQNGTIAGKVTDIQTRLRDNRPLKPGG
ncbi:CNP1-like family protein [Glaciimonas sp. Gout2]|uniref:CNP1-like family protein n=2 Tax=Glaciimonas TaxID=1229970 RepID=UPI002AB34B15|nr:MULTISPECIES: CNP1-like family protein [unclassified Glaciimonas]MDY7545637.1 CNP1-like family protein [Glaciimonas sp. CA11.2]MEB0014201.1 CNP1-like family protein [Glaciimonas sp. Cout2]MEB0084375.1 CNP1-like family protein [Glaciimonas sp. Gout2]